MKPVVEAAITISSYSVIFIAAILLKNIADLFSTK